MLLSPLDYQVVQRTTKGKGTTAVAGKLLVGNAKTSAIEARIIAG